MLKERDYPLAIPQSDLYAPGRTYTFKWMYVGEGAGGSWEARFLVGRFWHSGEPADNGENLPTLFYTDQRPALKVAESIALRHALFLEEAAAMADELLNGLIESPQEYYDTYCVEEGWVLVAVYDGHGQEALVTALNEI